MPHDYKGITWYVKGVDSVATHRVDGTPINPLVWCRHDETGGDFERNTHTYCMYRVWKNIPKRFIP